MPESELARKITKAVKVADKLARDIRKDVADLIDATRELKEIGRDEEGKGV